ncbi:flagellar biosynthesis protein FlhB [Salinispira pacifica]|uniref:Flagellar biosynthetic protein FlhB n=1 Tax=Salinispira pacifica TaxID=1307761 RepID=V5WG59_9SPIO|nr:flagellar biosynthesis protein FlhB [Salinispira pacifica]AHC14600.1 Flagellar biosynthesis protein FlhB [Salinispira pacifica]
MIDHQRVDMIRFTNLPDFQNRPVFERMTLQWFAAEDEGRTEEPTEQKIRKAREDGKVAKSQDVSSTIVLLGSIAVLAFFGRGMFNTMQDMVKYYLGFVANPPVEGSGVLFRAFFSFFLRLTLPVAITAFVMAILGNLIQVGFLFTTKPLKPDFKKIAPNFPKYFKRTLLSTEALFNLSKSIVKVVIVVSISFFNVFIRLEEITGLVRRPFMEGVFLVADIAFLIILEAAIVMLIFSLIDYWFQRKQHRESLKMTKQEVKEERKNFEGDPQVKARLKERMREILQSNMMRKVPEADVVVTNPTHFAVALEYQKESMNAPMVTAKGQDHIAQRMKAIAAEHQVPVMENKPLARALYADVEIGDQIPAQHYQAVAELLKMVYRMNNQKEAG